MHLWPILYFHWTVLFWNLVTQMQPTTWAPSGILLKRHTLGPYPRTELEYAFLTRSPGDYCNHSSLSVTAIAFPLNNDNPNILLSTHIQKHYKVSGTLLGNSDTGDKIVNKLTPCSGGVYTKTRKLTKIQSVLL